MTESAKQAASPGEHLILYDGVCGLCDRLNRFVLQRDTRSVFDFASLQSALSRSLLLQFSRSPDDLSTLYVVTHYRSDSRALLDKSDAALFTVKTLGSPWSWLGLLRAIPRPVLNRLYDWVARNRYSLFGRSESCRLPNAEHRSRFIDV